MRRSPMLISLQRYIFACSLLCAGVCAPGTGQGQPAGPMRGDGDWRFSVAATPAYQLEASLDGGSKVSVARAVLSGDVTTSVGAGDELGLSVLHDYEEYDFTGTTRFGGPSPWEDIHRLGLSVPYSRRIGQGWRLFISPSAEYARETNADWGTALSYGVVVSAGKRISADLTVGAGAGVFSRLEQSRAFPFLMISWKISERWRLANPLRAGPTGPAGLELIYAATPDGELGFGSAYRSIRFRLDDRGIAPRGIGEVRGAPAWVRFSRSLGQDIKMNLYGGALFGGKFVLENEWGGRLGSEPFGPAAFAALAVTATF